MILRVLGEEPEQTTIYLARVSTTDQLCIVRELRERAIDEVAQERIESAVAVVADHPNVMALYSAWVKEEAAFYLQELLHGRRLSSLFASAAEHGPPPPSTSCRLLAGAARGVGSAHARGRTQQGLQAEHVFVTYDGATKVVDLGRRIDAVPHSARVSNLDAVIPYLSPEAVRGQPAGAPSDVYSLGVMLWTLTIGSPPHPSNGNLLEVLGAILGGTRVRPSDLASSYPRALEAVLLRALAMEPGARFPTGDALADALDSVAAELGSRDGQAEVARWMEARFGAIRREREAAFAHLDDGRLTVVTDPVERDMLAMLADRPEASDVRAVYGDWLEERAELAKAEYVRMEKGRPDDPAARRRRWALEQELDPFWCRAVRPR